MIKVIAVLGGKGGSGKSTCSIGLGIALAKQGNRVLLIDMDEGMRCLDMLLGVSEKLLFDVSDAVAGRELSACVLSIEKYSGLSLLAASPKKGLVDPEAFGKFIADISESEWDAVILDLPAGSDKKLYKSLPPFTEFVCVCNPNAVSVRDASNIGSLLREINRNGSLVINRFEPYFIKNPVFGNIDDIINESGLTLLGIVPDSENLAFAFLTGKFPTKGKAARAFDRIAKRLSGKNISLPKLKKI